MDRAARCLCKARERLAAARPACAVLLAAVCVAASGCQGPPPARSTRLTHADLTEAALSAREQLAQSRFLQGRTGSSPEARLVVRRVENLSTDRIPLAEQWSLVARLLSDPGMQELLRSKAVVVQLPPEKVELLERGGLEFPALRPENLPTHMLGAQISSATRAGALQRGGSQLRSDIRKEYYLITFDLEDIQTRELLWQGTAEIAREAEGTIVD